MNKLVIMSIGATTVAVASVVISAATSIHNHFIMKKLEKALGKIEESSEEKISEKMINAAIEKAARNNVTKYMEDVEASVLCEAKSELTRQAKAAVEKEASAIRDKVSEKISDQVADLDIEKLKKRVCDKAEEHIIDKFDGCLDDTVKRFHDKLDDTKKILDSISRAALEKDKKDSDRIRLVIT